LKEEDIKEEQVTGIEESIITNESFNYDNMKKLFLKVAHSKVWQVIHPQLSLYRSVMSSLQNCI